MKAFPLPGGGSQRVLDVPALDLDEGEEVALEGRSGSGKTTLLHAIAGILRVDAGSIRIDGVDVAALGESARDAFRARHIGYVFQSFHLLQGHTALENVLLGMAFGRGADPDRAAALLRKLGLGDRMHHLPRALSVGQQQRVALARAVAHRPRLVLADEPTGNLDPAAARDALDLIRSSCRECGAALLLVSHDRDVLAGFDRRLRLADCNRAAATSPAAADGGTAA